jgi:restriction system protein
VEWEDIRELDDLFRSEGLETPHGVNFDQRFVDFLAANFEEIDRIHWRQFEALTAEYFAREGWSVLLGPGRNDGGVDIRLWPDDSQQSSAPATVLVQCKREKRNIQKTVLKALWADVVHEKAESGLIVTTSSFSPGAAVTRTARGYPVAEANRRELQRWVRSMSPHSGPTSWTRRPFGRPAPSQRQHVAEPSALPDDRGGVIQAH